MCDITSIESEIKTGYKVVLKREDRFFSSFTGQELKPGKVPLPPETYLPPCRWWNQGQIGKNFTQLGFYNPDFVGKTGIFPKLSDCEGEFLIAIIEHSLTIVKITFSGKVFKGRYNGYDIIAGDTIEEIEEVENWYRDWSNNIEEE